MAMFSNSNDVFRTQADTRFNSFADPQNPVNQNSGNWGVDPNYLTPAYTSPFRPRYQGPTGNTYGRGSPTFGQALNQTLNPFAGGGSNYGGNYWQQTSPYYDSLVNRPTDAVASFTQNWAVPGLATLGAYKYLGKGAERMGGALGAGLTRGIFGTMGTASQAGSAMAIGRGLGAMGGSVFLPALAAQGAVKAFDSAVADPYIAQRQMGRSLRDNFSGINFGEGVGDKYTGGGLSRSYAQTIAKNMSVAGAKDMTFNQQETAQLTDLSSRAGLLDNTSASQMSSRFEAIMKQVKVVMAIANTSDFKETIEIMSKMQMSGVNPNQLSGAMGRMSAMAGAGGQSMQKILNTVGAQGQYMFSAAGLTPYEGTMSGFGASAAHSAAYRSGLLSPAMMARMGGVEGASQSSIAGTIGMYSTPYASMMGSNAYRGGGEMGNVVNNMAQFGGRIAANPLQNIASHMALGKATTSKMIGERGLQGEQDMIYQIAQQIPGGVKNGKVTSEVAYMIMTDMLNISPESATAKLSEFSAVISPKTSNAMMAGIDTASVSAISKYRQQEGLDKGIFTSPYNAVKRSMMRVQESGAMAVGGVLQSMGNVGDVVEKTINETLFNVKEGDNGLSIEKAERNSSGYEIFDLTEKFADNGKDETGAAFGNPRAKKRDKNEERSGLSQINKALISGDEDAQTFMTSTGYKKQDALDKLVKKGKVDSKFSTSIEAQKLITAADKASTKTLKPGEVYGNKIDIGLFTTTIDGNTGDKTPEGILKEKLNEVLPGGKETEAISLISLTSKISKQLDNNKLPEEKDLKTLSEILKVDASTLGPQKLKEVIADVSKKAGNSQVYHLAGLDVKEGSSSKDILGVMKDKGMPLLSPKIDGGDDKAIKAQTEVQKAMVESRSRLTALRKNNIIDDSTYQNANTALDNKEVVGKFSAAVDKFATTVNGDKPTTSDGKPVPHVWDVLKEKVSRVGRN